MTLKRWNIFSLNVNMLYNFGYCFKAGCAIRGEELGLSEQVDHAWKTFNS